jgi:hypothetical protein
MSLFLKLKLRYEVSTLLPKAVSLFSPPPTTGLDFGQLLALSMVLKTQIVEIVIGLDEFSVELSFFALEDEAHGYILQIMGMCWISKKGIW